MVRMLPSPIIAAPVSIESDTFNQYHFLAFYHLLKKLVQTSPTIFVVEKPTAYQPSSIDGQRNRPIQEQQPVGAFSTPSVIIRTIFSKVRMIFLNKKFLIYF
jgi:hypothetical protein